MTILLIFGLGLAGVAAVLALRAVAFNQGRRHETLAQIDSYGFSAAQRDVPVRRPLRAVVAGAATAIGGRVVARVKPERERELRTLLNAAGYYRTTTATFLGYRLLGIGALVGFSMLLVLSNGVTVRGFVMIGFAAALGWVLPKFVLQKRGTQRLNQVDREVPELVDLLVTTVEAGVGFAAALQLAARSIKGPLGEELRLVMQEQSMGLTTEEALRNLAGRVDSPAVRAFMQALVQGESLGVSIGKILRDLAVDMRKRRRQAAEERAQKAPTKILFPLIFLILPAMFIVTLGPALMTIMKSLGSW